PRRQVRQPGAQVALEPLGLPAENGSRRERRREQIADDAVRGPNLRLKEGRLRQGAERRFLQALLVQGTLHIGSRTSPALLAQPTFDRVDHDRFPAAGTPRPETRGRQNEDRSTRLDKLVETARPPERVGTN